MTSVRIGTGTELSMHQKIFSVRQNLGDGILQLESKMDGELVKISRLALANAVLLGEAHIPARNTTPVKHKPADLSALPDWERDEVSRRWKYVKAVEKPKLSLKGRDLVQAVIPVISEKIQDPHPPSWQQLYRWLKLYRDAGKDLRALAPKTRRRGNRKGKLPEEVVDVIEEVIRERFLVDTRPRASDVYSAIQVEVNRMNQIRPEWEQLPIPSIRTLYRQIDRLDQYTKLKGRYGTDIANREVRHVGTGAHSTRPLERVEIDHTPMDIIIVDEESGMPFGKPNLTMVIDHFTRMPLGFYVGFTEPSTAAVMMAMRMALAPKDWVHERFPEIKGKWPCFGVPEVLVTDNGPEFHSQDLELACAQLGILIQHNRVKAPWTKGVVERFLGEINRSLLADTPGKTFNKLDERADYDSVGKACIPLPLLEELICQWIIDVHAIERHDGIDAIPIQRWNESIEEFPPRLFSSTEDLDILLLGNKSEKTINPKGIILKGIWYSSPNLSEIRNSFQKSIKVDFKFDYMDLGRIHVLDPRTNEYLTVPAVDQNYASGLGYWQHMVIRKFQREMVNAGHSSLTAAEAREEIHRKAQQHIDKPKNMKKTNKRVGRLKEADGSKAANKKQPASTEPKPTYSILPEDTHQPNQTLEDWFADDDDGDEELLSHDMRDIQTVTQENNR